MQLSTNVLLSFIGIVSLLVIFPGPNTVLVIQSVGLQGRKAGFYIIAGFVFALCLHAIIFSFGFSAIIVKSLMVYNLIKFIGAGYIIYLGLSSIYSAYQMNRKNTNAPSLNNAEKNYKLDATLRIETPFQSYVKGFITNLFNPKVVFFFISFFPQFIQKPKQFVGDFLLLVIIYTSIVILWYSVLVCFVAKLKNWLENNIVLTRIRIVLGMLLFGLGIKIAVQK